MPKKMGNFYPRSSVYKKLYHITVSYGKERKYYPHAYEMKIACPDQMVHLVMLCMNLWYCAQKREPNSNPQKGTGISCIDLVHSFNGISTRYELFNAEL